RGGELGSVLGHAPALAAGNGVDIAPRHHRGRRRRRWRAVSVMDLRTNGEHRDATPSFAATNVEASFGSTPAPETFRAIYRAHVGYVWSSLRRLGVPERDVEDVAHDTMFAVYRKLAEYDPSRPLRPWLFGYAYRFAADYRKR